MVGIVSMYDFFVSYVFCKTNTKIDLRLRKVIWRPGRDLDPGPAGDSRIYWTGLYYLGN
jgi:hypothetical protein